MNRLPRAPTSAAAWLAISLTVFAGCPQPPEPEPEPEPDGPDSPLSGVIEVADYALAADETVTVSGDLTIRASGSTS